ncbi:MAG: hypothetical protein H0X66_18920 [Verrucomicrobia bacterium]|nr:hypothetical protein [Verrucomicrobiota bacterium]
MMILKILKFIPAFLLLAFLSLPQSVQACATCFGKSDSKLAEGMNWGIMVLLLVVGFVLTIISAFFVYIAKRASTSSENLKA